MDENKRLLFKVMYRIMKAYVVSLLTLSELFTQKY